jgi:hypothetical protein
MLASSLRSSQGPNQQDCAGWAKRKRAHRFNLPGHPRSSCLSEDRTWMPGTRPGMTNSEAAKGTVANVFPIPFSNSSEIVIASEAKQSIVTRKNRRSGLLRRFAPRNDGKHTSAFPRRDAPEFCVKQPPYKNRGRGECRAPNAPAASRANEKSTRASHHRFTGITRHSRTQWF